MEPVIGGKYYEIERFGTGEIDWNGFIIDGKYKVWAKTRDKLGLSAQSNKNTEIVVDTTSPNSPNMIQEPEFSPGEQNLVKATNASDPWNFSNPIQYEFCRSDDFKFIKINIEYNEILSRVGKSDRTFVHGGFFDQHYTVKDANYISLKYKDDPVENRAAKLISATIVYPNRTTKDLIDYKSN